jgi:4-deoxy-L-threo-5-hexosulose-uronate ketol-isomerase
MYSKVLYATPPEAIRGVDAATLADKYLLSNLFSENAVSLTYSHTERFIIGGACPAGERLKLPAQKNGAPFLERREVGIINVGGAGRVTVDGAPFDLHAREG